MSSESNKKTTLVILLDAFSKTYFSKKHTPFLYDLSQNGVVTDIEPLFAFKGIETTIFTGVWPNIHNVWTEFCFINKQIGGKKKSLIRNMLIKAVDLLYYDEPRVKLRYAIERYLLQSTHRTPSLVPAAAMPYFKPSQGKEITEPGAVDAVGTIFDVFREKRVRFVFIEPWISGDSGVLFKARRLIKRKHKYRFWYLKFNSLDRLGHKFGPTPFAFRKQLAKVDRYVEEVVNLLRGNPNLNVLVLADHGMSKVRKTVNILEGLNDLGSRMYKDYIAFADSTMIRFWFFNKKSKQEIREYLRQIKFGYILTGQEKKLLKVPLDPKYGETIYVMDEGCIVHPCFFHSKSVVNGMHGYAYPRTPEAHPILILNSEIADSLPIRRKVTYADIAQLILRSLSIV